jgi:hypothetical protein
MLGNCLFIDIVVAQLDDIRAETQVYITIKISHSCSQTKLCSVPKSAMFSTVTGSNIRIQGETSQEEGMAKALKIDPSASYSTIASPVTCSAES